MIDKDGFLYNLYDFFWPRFVTEECACLVDGDDVTPLYPAKFLEAGDRYDEILVIQSFNLFGYALFSKVVNNETS